MAGHWPRKHSVTEDGSMGSFGFHGALAQYHNLCIIEHVNPKGFFQGEAIQTFGSVWGAQNTERVR